MEFFIERVKLYPCVWDMNHMSYRNIGKKEWAWERIAKECGLANGKEAKLQWQKIRDSHREALRRRKTLNIKPWRYETVMEFLLPQIEYRASNFNASKKSQGSDTLSDANINIDTDMAATSPLPEPSRSKKPRNVDSRIQSETLLQRDKRREQRQYKRDVHRRRLVDIDRNSQDALITLFNSFCQKTRDLPGYLQLRVQREVFDSITRAEEEAMFEPNNSFSPSSSSASTFEYTGAKYPNRDSPSAWPVPASPAQTVRVKEEVLTDSD